MRLLLIALAATFLLTGCPKDDKGGEKPDATKDTAGADKKDEKKDEATEEGEEEGGW